MTEDLDALAELCRAASHAAAAAAELIRSRRPTTVGHKEGGGDTLASQVVTDIDRAADAVLVEKLAVLDTALGMLSEERPDDGSRLVAPAFWCIDPLDGTLAYVRGEPGPAVSVALVRRDGVPMIGVVHDVTTGQVIEAVRGRGLTVDGRPWQSGPRSEAVSVFGDHSFETTPMYAAIASRLGVGSSPPEVNVGQAAVLNAWSALSEPPGVYFKLPRPGRGGGSLWDYAATACICAEAGGVSTTFAGSPLPLNRTDTTFMADCGVLFASDVSLADRVRTAAAECGVKLQGSSRNRT